MHTDHWPVSDSYTYLAPTPRSFTGDLGPQGTVFGLTLDGQTPTESVRAQRACRHAWTLAIRLVQHDTRRRDQRWQHQDQI